MPVNEPDWSPDGAWVVFASSHRSPWSVYVVPAAGGTPEKLTDDTISANHAVWSPDGKSILFSGEGRGAAARGLYLMDWKTRRGSLLPGSADFVKCAWSPDANRIAASDARQIQVFDRRTERWTFLAAGQGLGGPFWSRDGKYVYYQDALEAEQPIYRAPAAGGKVQRMVSSRQIPQSDLTAYTLAGLAPDDAPIAAVIRKNADIYALDLDLP
jgi:TolB protein